MDWHEANAEYNKYISQLFHEESWENRAEAARQLGLLKDGRATNLLCRALRNETDHMVINRIIEALGRIGDAKATMRIIEKLQDELDKFEGDKFRVIYILEALTGLKDKRALPYISSFLNSPDEDLKNLPLECWFDERSKRIISQTKESQCTVECYDEDGEFDGFSIYGKAQVKAYYTIKEVAKTQVIEFFQYVDCHYWYSDCGISLENSKKLNVDTDNVLFTKGQVKTGISIKAEINVDNLEFIKVVE